MLLHSLLLATAVAGQPTPGAATTPQQSPSERRTEPAQSHSSSAVDALLTRIDAATESGRVYHREKLLQQLYRVAPRHPKTLSLRIDESLSASDKAQAQAYFALLRSDYPTHPLTAYNAQRLYLEQPENQSLLAQARIAMLAGKQADARNYYEQLFDQPPLIEPYRSDWLALHNEQPVAEVAEEIARVDSIVEPLSDVDPAPPEAEPVMTEEPTSVLAETTVVSEPVELINTPQNGAPPLLAVVSDARQALTLDQTPTLTLGYQSGQRSATDGLTSLDARSLLVNLTIPTEQGRWWVKLDGINASAGRFDLSNTFQRERFGTGLLCQQEDCTVGFLPEAEDRGIAVGLGYETTDWTVDIGVSPVGFNRTEILGGIGTSGDFGTFSWGLELERRIETTALLNFSGIDDPFSTREWGPVTRTGLGASLSWDQGELFGWWSNVGINQYAGHDIDDNSQWYAYTGAYWRLIDTEHFGFTAGLTGLSWGFAENRGETTYGHGAYYSPQHYVSLSVPLQFYGRFDRFSYIIRASFGQSQSRIDAAPFYPTEPALQQAAGNPQHSASPDGGGFGKSYRAAFEYRITDSWVVGLSTQIERSEFYTPNNYLLYLRYDFGNNNLALRPPEPPSRYVDR